MDAEYPRDGSRGKLRRHNQRLWHLATPTRCDPGLCIPMAEDATVGRHNFVLPRQRPLPVATSDDGCDIVVHGSPSGIGKVYTS